MHVPALVGDATVTAMGWVCPLTPLKNALRRLAREVSCKGGFIEYYLMPAIYPLCLRRELHIRLAVLLVERSPT